MKLELQELAIGLGFVGIAAYFLWPQPGNVMPESLADSSSPVAEAQFEDATGINPFLPAVYPAFDADGFELPSRQQAANLNVPRVPDYLWNNRATASIAPNSFANSFDAANWAQQPSVPMLALSPAGIAGNSPVCDCC